MVDPANGGCHKGMMLSDTGPDVCTGKCNRWFLANDVHAYRPPKKPDGSVYIAGYKLLKRYGIIGVLLTLLKVLMIL